MLFFKILLKRKSVRKRVQTNFIFNGLTLKSEAFSNSSQSLSQNEDNVRTRINIWMYRRGNKEERTSWILKGKRKHLHSALASNLALAQG